MINNLVHKTSYNAVTTFYKKDGTYSYQSYYPIRLCIHNNYG